MLTRFGKEIRKLRIDNSMLLREMADHLDVSPAWLSAVETGRKNIPDHLVDQIVEFFELQPEIAAEIREAAAKSQREYKIRLQDDADEDRRGLAAVFARRFDDLSPAEIRDIQDILNRRHT